jgi:hypothetical protein
MHNWTDFKARENALWDFCRRMRANRIERERCKKDRWYAKTYFAENWFYLEGDPQAGNFATIPAEVEFRVYEIDPPAQRDDLVTIVLPSDDAPLPLPDHRCRGIEDVWRCTWPSYLTVKELRIHAPRRRKRK